MTELVVRVGRLRGGGERRGAGEGEAARALHGSEGTQGGPWRARPPRGSWVSARMGWFAVLYTHPGLGVWTQWAGVGP